MTKATVKTVPSFTQSAKALGKAYESFDNATAKLSATVCATFTQYLDACTLAGVGKTEKEITAMGKAIRENEVVAGFVAAGLFEKSTFSEYAQSAMRAYYHGVEFAPSLKNDKNMALPWGKAKAATPAKAGKVESTDRAALDATISKAIKQARLLGLVNFAAELVDLAADSLDGFTEATE